LSYRNTYFTNEANAYFWEILCLCLNLGLLPFFFFVQQVKKQSQNIREGTDGKVKLNTTLFLYPHLDIFIILNEKLTPN